MKLPGRGMDLTFAAVALLATVFNGLLQAVSAKKDLNIYCGACIAMIEEANYDIGRADKKQKIQVGSFRIDPNGNQNLNEIPYARSDVHLMEVFEGVCNRMSSYGETTDEKTGLKSYIRTSSVMGSPVSLKNVKIDGDISKKLKSACESLVEDYEEDMMPFFKSENADVNKKVCIDLAGVCDAAAIERQLWATAMAVQQGMMEQADKNKAAEDPDDEEEGDDDDNDDDDDEDNKEAENETENTESEASEGATEATTEENKDEL